MTNVPDIGKRIKAKRIELGMTQEDLANKLGYKSKTTIAKIENGTNDITQSRVVDFANVLNTTPAYLMGWNNKTNANFDKKYLDRDVFIIQREKNKMSSKEQTKLMDLIRTNFDDYNWDEDDSGDIE